MEMSWYGLFDLSPDETVEIRVGDLQEFLRQQMMGVTNPGLEVEVKDAQPQAAADRDAAAVWDRLTGYIETIYSYRHSDDLMYAEELGEVFANELMGVVEREAKEHGLEDKVKGLLARCDSELDGVRPYDVADTIGVWAGEDGKAAGVNIEQPEKDAAKADAAMKLPAPAAGAARAPREVYLEWLSAEIGLYCDADGRFPAEWDYDQLSPDTILGAWCDFEGEGYGNARDLLEDRVLAAEREGLLLELSGYLERDLPEAAPEVAAAYRASEDVMADLEEAGFAGFSANLDDLLGKTTFRVDAFFATQAELDRGLRSIGFAFDESRFLDMRLNSRPVELALDNALSYLVNQQGHSVVEVCDAVRGEQPESDFIASVAEELAEHVIDAGALCALLEMDGEQMMGFLGEWNRPVDYLVLPKGTTIGVYSEMHGAGGRLGVRLERDAVLPMAMCHSFTVEGQSGVDGYTVDSCYGLSESCWRAGASYQKFPGKLLYEDYDRALDEARARAGAIESPLPPARAEVDRLPRDRLPGGQATSRSR